MNLYFRLLLYILKSFSRTPIGLFDASFLRFHVLPNDLDFNMHMNNGRYLTLMDLGRLDFMKRIGVLRYILRSGYAPVLSAVKMRYRLPLTPFQPFDLQTNLICWDEKWVYMEQRFVIAKGSKAGAVAAIALLKAGIFDGKTKNMITPSTLLRAVGKDQPSPSMPQHMIDWQNAEESLKTQTQ